MRRFFALIVLAFLAGCGPSRNEALAVADIESLAAKGFRDTVTVSGYYFGNSEQDAIFQEAQPSGAHLLLDLIPFFEEAKIASNDARRGFMARFHAQRVTVTGTLCSAPFHVGGLSTGEEMVRTFITVQKIEGANQALLPTSTAVTPAAAHLSRQP